MKSFLLSNVSVSIKPVPCMNLDIAFATMLLGSWPMIAIVFADPPQFKSIKLKLLASGGRVKPE